MRDFLSVYLSVFRVPMRDYVSLWAISMFVLAVIFYGELAAAVVLMLRAAQ